MDPSNTPLSTLPQQPSEQPQPVPLAAPAPASTMAPAPVAAAPTKGTSGLAIAGLVLAILAPLVGLILSIIALIKDKKRGRSIGVPIAGIVVSGVSMVVGGILLALVVTTFTGIQGKARDTERQTDIKAIYGQVEAYYAQKGQYPTLANLNDASWRTTNLSGLDPEALKDPKSTGITLSSTPSAGSYSYEVKSKDDSTCDNVKIDCVQYKLTATMESGKTFTRSNLNADSLIDKNQTSSH